MNAQLAIQATATRGGVGHRALTQVAPAVEWLKLSAITPALARDWDELADAAAEPNAFAERWFIAASAPLAGETVRLLVVREGGLLIGLLPLEQASRYGRLPIRHVENWLHYHAFLGGPLLRGGYEEAAWAAMLGALDAEPQCAGLLHLTGLVEHGPVHRALTAAAQRPCDTVHRIERALLESDLAPQAYYEATVRKKKRKEIGRLQSRLSELGTVTTRRLSDTDSLDEWIDAFLALEAGGWKGRAGSALACQAETESFFRSAVYGAHDAGKLQMLRLDLNDQAIAILVNLICSPGSFSFKTAFDEAYARYSPGVLIQLANLEILTRADFAWMDSCAAQDHPMIDSLWGQRRAIIRVTLPLAGWRSRFQFHAARAVERAAAAVKRWRKTEPAA